MSLQPTALLRRGVCRCQHHSTPWWIKLTKSTTTKIPNHQRQKHHFSTASASLTNPPRIISRQVLAQRQKQNANTKNSSKTNTSSSKTEESSWPQSVRLAFYAAVTISIPCTILTFVAEFPWLRAWLEGDRPHDAQDCPYGKKLVQWTREHWTPVVEDEDTNQRASERFPGESLHWREEVEQEVELRREFLDRDVEVSMTVQGNNVKEEDWVEKRGVVVDGGLTLHQVLQQDQGSAEGLEPVVFVDFTVKQEDQEKVKKEEEGNATLDPVASANLNDTIPTKHREEEAGKTLRQLTQTWSAWHTFDVATSSSSKTNKDDTFQGMTAQELRQSELEWKLAQLQQQMMDPFNTRDIAEMQEEERVLRRELRRIRGWRWNKLW